MTTISRQFLCFPTSWPKNRLKFRLVEESLAVAQSQQARSLELRAAADLARLYRDHGRSADARDLLARVYSGFTEGFDTLDLKEAEALLDELA
jgi:predicted ATPase